MEIVRAGSKPSGQGPGEWFTGQVWIDEIVPANPPDRPHVVRVTFAPAARTAWHTHPHGQTLHITAGSGRIGRHDGTVEQVTAGDTVWFAPGERHWHGAAPDALMVHLAIQQADADGSAATWAEHVDDVAYAGTGS